MLFWSMTKCYLVKPNSLWYWVNKTDYQHYSFNENDYPQFLQVFKKFRHHSFRQWWMRLTAINLYPMSVKVGVDVANVGYVLKYRVRQEHQYRCGYFVGSRSSNKIASATDFFVKEDLASFRKEKWKQLFSTSVCDRSQP